MRRFRFLVALPLLALAACVAAPEPAPPPRPAPTPAPAPRPSPTPAPAPPPFAGNWMDAPLTQGDWSYARTERGSSAYFGLSATQALFSITCVVQLRNVVLHRTQLGAKLISPLVVRTETQDRSFPASLSFGGDSVNAALIPSDSFLDAMAFSKGRFAVEVEGAPPLYVPAYPEVTWVIEDCR